MPTIPDTCYDWEESVCDNVEEVPTNDAPEKLRNHAATISYYDANLHYSIITGR